ncbi:MAG: hypothetical protein G01um101431_349 [Parcubacteria group bacterium Gr01-1014_31]|nr:MAG: hypothetical protein G01um101431_349 [Parcubacteria group bacterium Gr01-1014_31]
MFGREAARLERSALAAQPEIVKSVVTMGLSLIDPTQPYGTDLFNALARLTVTVAAEAVAIRRNPSTGVAEVLLTQRPATERAYPGEWHCPGSALRPGELIQGVFTRLSRAEFFTSITTWKEAGVWNNPNEARGHFLHLVYLCRVESGSRGQWFPIELLPTPTVDHHVDQIIPMALRAYNALETPW